MLSFFSKLKYFDIPLLISTLLLSLVGLSILYSTSLSTESTAIFWRQLTFWGIGAVAFFFFAFFDYHQMAKINRAAYVLFIVLLGILLVIGSDIRGGRRWFDVGFFRFQPAEFVKLVVILGLARLLYLQRGAINHWKTIIISFLYAFIPAALVLLEPDLGSSLVLIGIWAGMIFISQIKKRYVAIIITTGLIIAGFSWQFLLKDFQKSRIEVFLNPSLDPRGRGYNVRQAAIAVGSGQWFGRGLGKGLQSQNKFLPERQTDFIFAASAEEIGFFGISALLALFFFLFSRLLKIMRKAKDDLGMYIVGGVFFFLLIHVVINIGMNIGILPVTGIPLPFMSAGGSSLFIVLCSLGIVQNIAMESKALRF